MKIEGSIEMKCKRYFIEYEHQDYEIDVITGMQVKEFLLSCKGYGQCLYMFGIPAETKHPDEYFIQQAPEYIAEFWEMVEAIEGK